MKALLLGTGTSVGVPMIGCECPVCASTDPRNKRRRASLYLQGGGVHIVVDTTPDFRDQALIYRIPRVDAVLFTHSHADHIFGFDDIRRYNTMQKSVIPAYANAATIADLQRVFNYILPENPTGLFRPMIEFRTVAGPFTVGGLRVEPLPVIHDPKPTLGFRFDADGCSLGYVPDCSEMPAEIVERLKGVDVMILDALRFKPHKTHLTVEASVNILRQINAPRSFLIHMNHELDHADTESRLPPPIKVSYDGLRLEW